MLTVKVGAVGINHPGEAQGLVLQLVELLEAAHQAGLHALSLVVQIISAIDSLTHLHTAEKVMVLHGRRAQLWNDLEVLEICLNNGRAGLQHFNQCVLTLDRSVHHFVHRRRRCRAGHSAAEGCDKPERKDENHYTPMLLHASSKHRGELIYAQPRAYWRIQRTVNGKSAF